MYLLVTIVSCIQQHPYHQALKLSYESNKMLLLNQGVLYIAAQLTKMFLSELAQSFWKEQELRKAP